MGRTLRVWGKKRGHRRTGSALAGSLGEALFSGVLFLLGVVSLTALIASQFWSSTPLFEPGFGFWLMFLVLCSFVLLGGGGVILTVFHVSASAERRSALARRAASIQIRTDDEKTREQSPTIPSDANLTNSPGVKLRYRLPIVQSPAWRLVMATAFCLIWNGSAAVLAGIAINSFFDERPDWFLTLFAIPFLAIGGWAIYDFVRQMLLYTGIGPTHVEISDHPLRPTGVYQVYVTQGGRLLMRSFSLSLVCVEAATYREGTNVRAESKAVFDRQLFRKSEFTIEPGMPFEHTCTLHVPPDAMHSFQSEHNALNWRLVVRGEADRWPPFERSFPIIVHPAHDGNENGSRTADRD